MRSFALTVLFCISIICSVSAQPDDPDGGGNPDSGVPIDGGISLLAAAGVAYGVHQLRKRRKDTH